MPHFPRRDDHSPYLPSQLPYSHSTNFQTCEAKAAWLRDVSEGTASADSFIILQCPCQEALSDTEFSDTNFTPGARGFFFPCPILSLSCLYRPNSLQAWMSKLQNTNLKPGIFNSFSGDCQSIPFQPESLSQIVCLLYKFKTGH